ncbi:MAG TPA: alkaline phosphatase PhoX [Candidatus Acidoferrum sp.]|nr:alkaline phosphatase PhoX [Candidatus Acidoferrum sp.]
MRLHHLSCALFLFLAAPAFGDDLPTGVPSANPKTPGVASPNILSPELIETPVAQGSIPLENPSPLISFYGYDNNGTLVSTTAGSRVEATKTEPDKNTYLILKGQKGADPLYNYGSHFLFQGHELGLSSSQVNGYITRVNLDADGAHRVTLMAATDINGTPLPNFDGSTWYPFSRKLLFTSEGSLGGGVWQASLDVPSQVEALTGIIGQGGYEGIQADPNGTLYIVEDVGGSFGIVNNFAKRPNSYIYRFIPADPSDLKKGGKLQVLQVSSLAHSGPIFFDFFADADAHILSQDELDLHTYGNTFDTTWVTIHDTAVNGTAPFNSIALAKAAHATPFKRPENGQFRPGSNFTEFFFSETGDTDNRSQAGAAYGGFGGAFKLVLRGNRGKLSLFYLGDQAHTGFDNCAFWDANHIVFVEDAGDTLHTQRNALDSAYLLNVHINYGGGAQPIRILAEGRDTSATLDSLFGTAALGFTGTFNNEGDNEITGWHVSDGDSGVSGLLGAKIPEPFDGKWRVFYTQQHGDNFTWEILPAPGANFEDSKGDH